MVRNVEGSNVRVIELGEGTTYISNVVKKNSKKSIGIVFSNYQTNILEDNSVIIEIKNSKGVFAYLNALIQFLKINQEEEENINLLNNLEKELMSINN